MKSCSTNNKRSSSLTCRLKCVRCHSSLIYLIVRATLQLCRVVHHCSRIIKNSAYVHKLNTRKLPAQIKYTVPVMHSIRKRTNMRSISTSPENCQSALSLLVLRVFTDNSDTSLSFNDFAFFTNWFY